MFQAKEIWRSHGPLRTLFLFSMEALTIDILVRREWTMVNRCSICKDS